MLYFSELNDSDFQQINDLKRSYGMKKANLLTRNEVSQVAFPHEVYSLGLDVLKKEKNPIPKWSGVRAIEIGKDHFNTIFDIYKQEGESEPQRLLNSKFIEQYERAFEMLSEINNDGSNYMVKLITVPSLHVEAIWLEDKSSLKLDKYLPVRSFGLFEDLELISNEKFYIILRNAAENKQQSNELLGG